MCYDSGMHFWHFLGRCVYTMPELVSGNWPQVCLGLFVFGFTEFLLWRKHGWPEMRKRWLESVGIGMASVSAGWIMLFFWSVGVGIYHDHFDVNGRWKAIVNEKNALKSGLSQRDNYIVRLQSENGLKPKTIMKTVTALAEKRCWFVNDPALPPSSNKVPGAVTTTAVILHCNYRLEAPYKIILTFDRDFIPGQLHVPDAMQFGGKWEKRGLVFGWEQDGPVLASDQIAVLVVYGPTDQYPKAQGGFIQVDQVRTQLEQGS